ncbi:hypothetical protein ABZ135_01110 [Streptomyces sp. NPDC006339]|uniref:hypothetical protein n=1 Tax=Streptomyces sp. NPDC006339 TaxID=3156755 RepID=UPI0033AC0F6F
MPEIEAVTADRLDSLLTDESIPVAHRALWAALWDETGRLDDLLSADIRDIDWKASTFTLPAGAKTDAGGTVPVSARTIALLREAVQGRDAGPLLTAGSGQALSREQAAAVAREAGVGIHVFRLGGQKHRLERASA